MANASKQHHMGLGAQGKGSGAGAMTPESIADGKLGENQVLSNRDKARASTHERGFDSKAAQIEQRQDSPTAHITPPPDQLEGTGDLGLPRSTDTKDGARLTQQPREDE